MNWIDVAKILFVNAAWCALWIALAMLIGGASCFAVAVWAGRVDAEIQFDEATWIDRWLSWWGRLGYRIGRRE